MKSPRRCIVVRGDARETAAAAQRLTAALPRDRVLWVCRTTEADRPSVHPRQVRALLGRSYDAVVLDLAEGLDADLLGQAQGFIVRGGALILRLPPVGVEPTPGPAALVTIPFTGHDVGRRFWRRVEERLDAAFVEDAGSAPVDAIQATITGTPDQGGVAASLAELFASGQPTIATIIADRGRGKSSALGLAIAEAARRGHVTAAAPVIVTAGERGAVREVVRHAGDAPIRFVSPAALLRGEDSPRIIVVDEAAQLPVPRLRSLVAQFPRSTLAFATTARGYEGTGRGFLLRFLRELTRDPRPLSSFRLDTPIRWDPDDPVEALVFDALALDAAPAANVGNLAVHGSRPTHREVTRDELASNEALLREYFGLLVHAHYRTTPSDLHRMLDAPNLRLHGSFIDGHVVGACLVALEGELPPAVTAALYRGERRIRGHALPETLISHAGATEAGEMSFVRSVRIATHPAARRSGIATGLTEHVHGSYCPDFFGTLFGATPELLAFRRSAGYAVVRVGSSRGVRTGEPTAVMLRPVTPRAEALMIRLRGHLARDIAGAVTLAERDGGLPLSADLGRGLGEDLPPALDLTPTERATFVNRYAHGGATYDSARGALEHWVGEHEARLREIDPGAAGLLRMRALDRRGWESIREAAGLPSVPATMKALRRAARALALHLAATR